MILPCAVIGITIGIGSKLRLYFSYYENYERIDNRNRPGGRVPAPEGQPGVETASHQWKSGPITILLFHNRSKICSFSPVSRSTVNISRASEDTPLIKQDIVHHVIERTGLPRTKAEAAVDTVFEGLKQALAAGERIELRGFGVFSVR